MKRLIASFIIIVLIFGYNVFSERYVLSYCEELNSRLEECGDNIKEENYSQAKNNISDLLDSWQKRYTFLSVLIGDEALLEPQKIIVSIYYSISDESYDTCIQDIRECQGYIREIYFNTRTNLGNVM